MRVFVYGTLKRGFGNNHYLSNSKFLHMETTVDKIYRIRPISKKGGYPIVTLDGDQQIFGELWEVPESDMVALDNLEGNGSLYTRQEVMLTKSKEKAWMYIFNHEVNHNSTVNIQSMYGVSWWDGRFSNT